MWHACMYLGLGTGNITMRTARAHGGAQLSTWGLYTQGRTRKFTCPLMCFIAANGEFYSSNHQVPDRLTALTKLSVFTLNDCVLQAFSVYIVCTLAGKKLNVPENT